MRRLPILLLALSLAVAACSRDSQPKSPKLAEVMPNVPLPPQATFVSRAGGADALQLTVRSPARADAVAAYYREVFKGNGWRLVNDAKDQEGAVVLFAEQNGPPLWVRIRNDEEGRERWSSSPAPAWPRNRIPRSRTLRPPPSPLPELRQSLAPGASRRARRACGLGQRIAGLGASGVARRSDQLAQHLGRRIGLGLAKLADRRGERPSERGRHREAGEPVLERLKAPPMRALGRR